MVTTPVLGHDGGQWKPRQFGLPPASRKRLLAKKSSWPRHLLSQPACKSAKKINRDYSQFKIAFIKEDSTDDAKAET